MKTVCGENQCTGCMACLEVCSKGAITIKDQLRDYHALIDDDKCVDCGACHRVCQNNTPVDTAEPIAWYQGWANEDVIRNHSSSGGFATSIAKSFIESGGYVCSCTFTDGEFVFSFAQNEADLKKFAGSKYVKSNPKGIYQKIQAKLKAGDKVLLIALPCQIAAAKNFLHSSLQKNFYTIDLICHGTPSPQNLAEFFKQYGYPLASIKEIGFRRKNTFGLTEDSNPVVQEGSLDPYTLAFLNSMNYTDNCYRCRYAKRSRVSDLTIGDSWGNSFSDAQNKRGVSLALCMTEKGQYLLEHSNLHLEDVDLENAIAHNRQLERPAIKPKEYERFFEHLNNGVPYNKAVAKALPRQCLNQRIKAVLHKLKIGGDNRGITDDEISYSKKPLQP